MTVNPSLVFASGAVLEHAERLMPGRTLEVEITKAIHAGRKRVHMRGMPELPKDWRYVPLEGDLVAIVAKGSARLTEREAWRVMRVTRIKKPTAALRQVASGGS